MQKRMNFKVAMCARVGLIVLVFWLSDFLMHISGVGESHYYYISKFANAILFSILWIFVFYSESHKRKILFSLAFGTWISFYYLVSTYSGLAQEYLGIVARETAPPFVIFGIFLSPFWWWVFHSLVFYIGTEVSDLLMKKDNLI